MDDERQVELMADAVQAVRTDILNENSDLDKCGSVYLARRLVAELRDRKGLMILPDKLSPSPVILAAPEQDRELSFLGAAVTALDGMGDLAVARVMAYLSDRYPPE